MISTCSAGFEFSEITLKCEPAATAGCSPVPIPADNMQRQDSPDEFAGITDPVGITDPATVPTQPTTDPSLQQICRFPGQRFVVQNNCRQFRACNWSRQVVTKQCPYRLKFDANLLICRFNAGCGKRPTVI